MAAAGVASRRACEDIILRGKVAVNGKIATLPQMMVDLSKDKVWVDGKPIQMTQKKAYFMIHKPKGYVCSSAVQEGLAAKPLVSILDPYIAAWRQGKPSNAIPPRLFTVGRLDVQTTGLIIVTNDGLWAQKVSHPKSGVSKEYIAKLNRVPSKAEIVKMQLGCEIDGVFVQPLYVDRAGLDPTSWERIRVVVTDGRNREVRRLVEHAGLDCLQLRRVRIGGLEIPDTLKVGMYREMTPAEVKRITDVGASNNLMVSKVERILSSGRRGAVVREKKYFR